MGEEAESEATWWGQTHPRRGPRAGREEELEGGLPVVFHVSPCSFLILRIGPLRGVFCKKMRQNSCVRGDRLPTGATGR